MTHINKYREAIKIENEKLNSLQKTLLTIAYKLKDLQNTDEKLKNEIKELYEEELINGAAIKDMKEIFILNQLKTIEELKRNITENDETILKLKQQTTELNETLKLNDETLKLNDEIQQKIQTALTPRPTITGGHPERFSSKGFTDINFDEIINNSNMSTHIDELNSSFISDTPTNIYTPMYDEKF